MDPRVVVKKIAKAAYCFLDSLKFYQNKNTIILRFFGTTSSSSTIVSVFKSVIYQLCRLFNLPVRDSYRTYNSLQMSNVLIEKLKMIKKNHPDQTIIFFFDSIDYSLEWMIKEFPSNSKFVFTTLNIHGSIIDTNNNEKRAKLS
jgi:hypothetical protein